MSRYLYIYSIFIIFVLKTCFSQTNINDPCKNGKGVCKHIADCPIIRNSIVTYLLHNAVPFCNEKENSVCCPIMKAPPKPAAMDNRILVRKCEEYSKQFSCSGTPLIFGGIKAKPREFPHMALIGGKTNGKDLNFFCGGTIISPDYILTAAHCLERLEINEFIVRLGELDYSTDKDDARPVDFGLSNAVVHPSFDGQKYDIAVLKLNGSVTFNDYIRPACLGWNGGEEFEDFLAAGWGLTENHTYSTHLLKANLKKPNASRCEEIYKSEFNENIQLCLAAVNGTDTCQGDSGGPAFVKHPLYNCLFTVFGVTESGVVCGSSAMPGLYTKINLYTDWIEKIVWDSATSFILH